jgi:hypothetical protein
MSSVYSIKIFYDLPLQTVLELPLVKLPVLVSPFLARQSSPEKNSANVMCPDEATVHCKISYFLFCFTVSRKLHRPMAAPTGYMPNLQAPGE